jgi:hypothetical protein
MVVGSQTIWRRKGKAHPDLEFAEIQFTISECQTILSQNFVGEGKWETIFWNFEYAESTIRHKTVLNQKFVEKQGKSETI